MGTYLDVCAKAACARVDLGSDVGKKLYAKSEGATVLAGLKDLEIADNVYYQLLAPNVETHIFYTKI